MAQWPPSEYAPGHKHIGYRSNLFEILFFSSTIFRFFAEDQRLIKKKNQKSNLHYTRRITPKRVTSCGAHLRGLAPGLHSSEEASQRWRVVGDTVPI